MRMYVSKIDLMYEKFGKGDSETVCAECRHFIRIKHHDKVYRKCEIYGNTASESTDWKAGYMACGLCNKDYETDRPIVEFGHFMDEQLPGQMSIDEYFGEIL